MLYNKSMVQDQLVDYISSQMKAGVSREAIKAALVGAGWVAADVEDTFKKVEGVAKTAPPASTALAGTSPSGASPASAAFKPAAMIGGGAVKSGEPQSIRVSDLVSASAAANLSTGAGAGFGKSTSTTKTQQPAGLAVTARMGADPKSAHGGRVMMIIGIVVIIVLGGLAGYLYFQNNNLASQVASLGSQSTGVTSQIFLERTGASTHRFQYRAHGCRSVSHRPKYGPSYQPFVRSSSRGHSKRGFKHSFRERHAHGREVGVYAHDRLRRRDLRCECERRKGERRACAAPCGHEHGRAYGHSRSRFAIYYGYRSQRFVVVEDGAIGSRTPRCSRAFS